MNALERKQNHQTVKDISICGSPISSVDRPRCGKLLLAQSLDFRTSVVRVVFESFVN